MNAKKVKTGEGDLQSPESHETLKSQGRGGDTDQPLSRKDYERELKKLHVQLVRLQQWVVHKGLKVCIVFEGRDGAGKGGTIKAITERVSPRIFRVVAPLDGTAGSAILFRPRGCGGTGRRARFRF